MVFIPPKCFCWCFLVLVNDLVTEPVLISCSCMPRREHFKVHFTIHYQKLDVSFPCVYTATEWHKTQVYIRSGSISCDSLLKTLILWGVLNAPFQLNLSDFCRFCHTIRSIPAIHASSSSCFAAPSIKDFLLKQLQLRSTSSIYQRKICESHSFAVRRVPHRW